MTLALRSDIGARGDVTVTSKAAAIPPVQLFTKASAGRDLERSGVVYYLLLQPSLQSSPCGKDLLTRLAAGYDGVPRHHVDYETKIK